MMEEISEMAREAKDAGLAVVIWSYPRGGDLTKEGETAVECLRLRCAYGRPSRATYHQSKTTDRYYLPTGSQRKCMSGKNQREDDG